MSHISGLELEGYPGPILNIRGGGVGLRGRLVGERGYEMFASRNSVFNFFMMSVF